MPLPQWGASRKEAERLFIHHLIAECIKLHGDKDANKKAIDSFGTYGGAQVITNDTFDRRAINMRYLICFYFLERGTVAIPKNLAFCLTTRGPMPRANYQRLPALYSKQ